MRPEKKGTDRTQLALGLLEEAIASDAFVRVIDLFVDQLGHLTRAATFGALRVDGLKRMV